MAMPYHIIVLLHENGRRRTPVMFARVRQSDIYIFIFFFFLYKQT